jgi:organic hydroperoxide reductase OsmC/OhrA
MSEHRATVHWNRNGTVFEHKEYTRDHWWHLDGGARIQASAAPQYFGNEKLADPERAFVAALSSCHMLTFLAVAAREGLIIDEYRDEAVGMMSRNEEKRVAITRVILRPTVVWGSEPPTREKLDEIHGKAHKHCFIANSVTTEISIEY